MKKIKFYLAVLLHLIFCIFNFELTSYAQTFTLQWAVISNPSAGGSDQPRAITVNSSGVYIAGHDVIPGNAQWRIEKRDLTTGAPITAFGGAGTGFLTINPSGGNDYADGITLDATGIYIAGQDNSPGNTQWRIEKRDLITGAPIPGFGIGGVVAINPSTNGDGATAVAADPSGSMPGLYVVGHDMLPGISDDQWHLEKLDLTNGGIQWTRTNNLSVGAGGVNDWANAVTIAPTGEVFVAGRYANLSGSIVGWRIEKRGVPLGGLLWSQTSCPGSGNGARAITSDASGIYVVGDDYSGGGSSRWRIEKRDFTTGALIPAFGTGGVVTNNISPGLDVATAITADGNAIYVTGWDNLPGGGNYQFRIEKRDPTTGALLCTALSNPSTGIDWPWAITVDATGVYVAGTQSGGGNQWRMEKYDLCSTPPTVTASGAVICAGDCATINANPSGGTSPYAYSWNSGGQTTSAITVCPTITTAYTVTITDGNSATATATATVTVNSIPAVTISPAAATICYGQNATLTASGALGYLWSTSETTTTITVSPTSNSIYSVTGADGNGCSNVSTASVTVDPLPVANAGPDISICTGQSATLNGSGNGSFQWSPPASLSSTTIANPTANPTISTSYTLTVTNSCGTISDEAVVTVSPLPVSNAGPDQSLCSGSNITLNGSGNGNFSWSPSTGLSNTTVVNPTANPTTTTTYTLTVTNSCGSASDHAVVSVTPLPIANAGPDISMCAGSSASLNGSGNGSFLWSPPTALNNTTIANPVASPTSTITYTLTVTNNCGTAADEMTISTPATPSANAGNDVTICKGNSTTLLGSGAGSFVWANGATLSCTSCQNPIATPTSTTTYTLTITDICGTQSDSVKVTVNDLQVTISPPTTICNGSSTTLTASGAQSYFWSPGGQISQNIIVNPTSGSTTYTVMGTDVAGCTNTNTSTITVNPKPAINISNPATICIGSSTTLTASGGATYLWSTAETTTVISIAPTASATYTYSVIVSDGTCQDTAATSVTVVPKITAFIAGNMTICNGQSATFTASGGTSYNWSTGAATNTIIVNPTTAASYSVVVTSGTCSDTAFASVTINTPPSALITGNTSVCSGSNATLTASGGINYLWSTSATTSSIMFSSSVTTIYTVTVTDANGCTAVATATTTVNPNPIAAISGNTVLCQGDVTTLTATGGGTYSWSSGQITSSIMLTPSGSSVYTVTVTGTNGCTAAATATINISSKPIAGILCSDTICEGDNATLTASGGVNYLWSSGQITSSVSLTPTATTNYSVIVSLGSCTATATCVVVVQPPPIVNAGIDVTITEGQSTTLTATGGGTYSWNSGETTQTINVSPIQTTTYCVTVTDNNGCTARACVTVTVEPIDCSNAGELYLPNAFSPNNDGENDVLQIYYGNFKCIQNLKLTIYDRWGQEVFMTTDESKSWDGKHEGNDLNTAVFAYYLDANLISGKKVTQKGNVSLVR